MNNDAKMILLVLAILGLATALALLQGCAGVKPRSPASITEYWTNSGETMRSDEFEIRSDSASVATDIVMYEHPTCAEVEKQIQEHWKAGKAKEYAKEMETRYFMHQCPKCGYIKGNESNGKIFYKCNDCGLVNGNHLGVKHNIRHWHSFLPDWLWDTIATIGILEFIIGVIVFLMLGMEVAKVRRI